MKSIVLMTFLATLALSAMYVQLMTLQVLHTRTEKLGQAVKVLDYQVDVLAKVIEGSEVNATFQVGLKIADAIRNAPINSILKVVKG